MPRNPDSGGMPARFMAGTKNRIASNGAALANPPSRVSDVEPPARVSAPAPASVSWPAPASAHVAAPLPQRNADRPASAYVPSPAPTANEDLALSRQDYQW